MVLATHTAAKINLGLHVLRRRQDGYHDLETVFLRIPWGDRLTVRPAARLTLTCSDPALPTDGRNLCMKAARVLAEAAGVTQGAALHLEKAVPYGAGLGGGSGDAAATLRLLVRLWDLSVSAERLHELAAALGSDVPFFLGPDAAYATGRGERLTPLRDPAGRPYRFPFGLVVAVPPVHVSTAEAYSRVCPHDAHRPDLRAVVASNELARWRSELVNDFEGPVCEAFPFIADVRERLLAVGAGYAALSGSGAAVFGVFETEEATRAALAAVAPVQARGWFSGREL